MNTTVTDLCGNITEYCTNWPRSMKWSKLEIIATHHIPSHWATAYNLHPSCERQFCSSVTRALPLLLCVCPPVLMQHWWNTLSSHVPTACSGLYCFHSVACIPLYLFFFWQTPVTAPTTSQGTEVFRLIGFVELHLMSLLCASASRQKTTRCASFRWEVPHMQGSKCTKISRLLQ